MRVVKRINNNAAICEDNAGHQLIALGNGIGFGELPREVSLDDVRRTFYGIDPKYLQFIDEVDPEVLEFSAQLADVVSQTVSYELSPNLPITLADHIQFAIKRSREHMVVPLPLAQDIEQSHPLEYRLGEMAVRGIKRTFNVRMQRQEAGGIALSIVNAMVKPSDRTAHASEMEEDLLKRATAIVERDLGVTVDRRAFVYTRFLTHVRYLIKRVSTGAPIESANEGLYEVMQEQYPRELSCARDISDEIEKTYGASLSKEEIVYLVLHVARIAGSGETR